MNSNFWNGFEKNASKAPLFRSIKKNIKIVGRRSSDIGGDKALFRLMMNQKGTKAVLNLSKKALGAEGYNQVYDGLRKEMQGKILGTIAPGKKGKRLYISRKMFRPEVSKGIGLSPRGVVHHEAFHAFAPAGLGNSEILAHIYGGLKNKKGKLDYGTAVKQLGHAFITRPGRASMEAILAGGTTYGASKGIKRLANKGDAHE